MGVLGNLLGEVVVTGSRAGAGAGGIGRLLGSSFGNGAGNFYAAPPPKFATASTAGADALAAGQGANQRLQDLYNGAAPANTNTIEGVDVAGSRPAVPSPGSAVGQALAGALANAPSSAGAAAAPTSVDELTVTATPKIAPPPGPELVNTTPPGLLNLSRNTPDMTGVTTEQPPQSDLLQNALLAAGAGAVGAGVAGAAAGGPGVPEVNDGAPGNPGETGAPGGSGLPFGLTPADLAAAGLLGTSLLTGTGGLGSAGNALKDIAAKNAALGDRLGNIADAGLQGNIGGKGLNSIARMVRKAQAAIRQRYASMGMSGSTAEADDLNDAVEAGVQQQFEIGQKMAATGLNAIAALTGQSANAYLALLNAQTAKNTALGNSLANFAAAITH